MFHTALSNDGPITSSDSNFTSHRVEEQLTNVKSDIERLLLITEGLWNILKEQHGFDDEELVRRVLAVDLSDGVIDGKVAAKPPGNCPHCDRPLSQDRLYCLYCGEPTPVELFKR